MSEPKEVRSNNSPSQRMLSIDALRGFDMFWIMGGEDVIKAVAEWGQWPVSALIVAQLGHVEWEGFHFYDLIFPLFLFIVGVVLPFSLDNLYWRILRRTALLFALGLLANNGGQFFDFAAWRIAGVLQRIALCYGIAAVILMNTRARTQGAIIVGLLLGYWALLALVPAPGGVAGDYSKEHNLAGYVDRHWLPGKIYPAYYGFGDNEGILSTIPAIATALLGVLAGHWLRSGQTPWRKVAGLAAAGAACLLTGWLWSFSFPIIKNIWTSSFVMVTGGWSLLLLATFYAVVDVLRFRAWAFVFIVIGANSILVYFLPEIFGKAAEFVLGHLLEQPQLLPRLALDVLLLILEWLFLWLLYRNRIFLRV
jgi:predicted acyltransferase